MTPDEWNTCTHAIPMLDACEGRVNETKLRSFACACARQMWDLLPSESRYALGVAEAFAAGNATEQQLAAVRSDAVAGYRRVDHQISFKSRKMRPPARAAFVVMAAVSDDAYDAARQAARAIVDLYDIQPGDLLRQTIGVPVDDRTSACPARVTAV